jgi:hypothetical protein
MKKVILFLVLSLTLSTVIGLAGCGGSSTTPPIEEDFINIVSVTPDSGLIDGVDTNFKVVVEYNLFSYDSGELSISFNNLLNDEGNPDNHWNIGSANYYINKGFGTHEFNVTVKPKDWGSEGDFSVWVCIDEIPQNDDWLLDCDEKILTFLQ